MCVKLHNEDNERYLCSANNDGLEVLDLSWNRLRMKGAVAFCAGLKVNKHSNTS